MLRKYPYIGKARNIKLRHDYIDIDQKFLKDLANNPKAAEYYNQFIKEAINADFRDARFYTDAKARVKIYQENNARNRCLFNRKKSASSLCELTPINEGKVTRDEKD